MFVTSHIGFERDEMKILRHMNICREIFMKSEPKPVWRSRIFL